MDNEGYCGASVRKTPGHGGKMFWLEAFTPAVTRIHVSVRQGGLCRREWRLTIIAEFGTVNLGLWTR